MAAEVEIACGRPKWLAVNCVCMQVAVKQEIPQTGSPRVNQVA